MGEVDPLNPLDVYADQLGVTIGPFGSALTFSLSGIGEEGPKYPKQVATIRMSLAHLKVMTYVLRRELQKWERQSELKVEVVPSVLSGLKITSADWNRFWNEGERE